MYVVLLSGSESAGVLRLYMYCPWGSGGEGSDPRPYCCVSLWTGPGFPTSYVVIPFLCSDM